MTFFAFSEASVARVLRDAHGRARRAIATMIGTVVLASMLPAAMSTMAAAEPLATCPAGLGCEVWTDEYPKHAQGQGLDGYENAGTRAVAQSPDGTHVYTVGNHQRYCPELGLQTSAEAFVVLAENAATGGRAWAAPHPTGAALCTARQRAGAVGVAVAPDGSTVFATGYIQPLFPTSDKYRLDYLTIAFDAATGEQKWSAQWNGPDEADTGENLAKSIAVSADGRRVYVLGSRTIWSAPSVKESEDIATVAYDAQTGGQLWERIYDGPARGSDSLPRAIYQDGGRFLAASSIVDATGVTRDVVTFVAKTTLADLSTTYATVTYDGASGAHRWTAIASGKDLEHVGRTPTAISANPVTGLVYVTGAGDSERGQDGVTIAYDLVSGARVWSRGFDDPSRTVPGPRADTAEAITVSPDGDQVVVTGASITSLYQYTAAFTAAYAADTGRPLWNRVEIIHEPMGRDVVFSRDGCDVYVTAVARGRTAAYAYDAASGQPYINTYLNNQGTAKFIVASTGRRVLVAGNREPGVGNALVVAAYDMPLPQFDHDEAPPCQRQT